MAAVPRSIVLQSTNSTGSVRESRAGVAATVEVADGKETWTIPASERGFDPKVGDRVVPIGTPKNNDKKPRTVTAVAREGPNFQLTCDVPAEPAA